MEKRPCSHEETFNKLLLDVVDESLSCMGESVRVSIYFHLENKFNLKKNEIPSRIDEYASAIEAILGLGAMVLEDWIMRRLYLRARCVVECCAPEKVRLPVYVAMVRTSFLLEAKNNSKYVQSAVENPDCLVLEKV